MGENWFLHRGIKYNIFGLIPITSYVTQTLNIKYRGTIEPRATHEQALQHPKYEYLQWYFPYFIF